jgi:predicted AlkP superfamily phosphohydrolase/phosphomutase
MKPPFLPRALRAAAALTLCAAPCLASPPQTGRVVVLGFDGADARTMAALMEKGELPNLKALAEQGTFGPLMTSNPAESPVSWSVLNTGQNPARTGVPGFVVRDLTDGGLPFPGIGFYESVASVPIEEFESTPIPTWPPLALGAALGAAVFVAFLVVFGLLLRLRKSAVVVLSLVLGGAAAWAGARLRSYLPSGLPVVRNTLEATPFWEMASTAGVPSVVLDAAQAWDREHVEGSKVLAGLGVPDARGQYNGFTIYTGDPLHFAYEPNKDSETPSAGTKLRVDWKDGAISSRLYGPRDFWRRDQLASELARVKERQTDPKLAFKDLEELGQRQTELEDELKRLASEPPLSVPLEVVRREDGSGARVALGDSEQDLAVGAWSDWYPLTFDLNPLIKVHALARAKLVALDQPHFTLYVDALQIDPARPPFWQPISQPAGFSAELAGDNGPYETVGWACMTLPYKDEEVDVVSFLEDIQFTFTWRERLTFDRLKRDDWRLFFSCFSTPDRVQHMCYRAYDEGHPLHTAAEANQRLTFFGEDIAVRDAIPAIYRRVDKLIGEVRAELRPDDVLILCSDHGFQSFRREVHLNNWLFEKGYLAVQPRLTKAGAKYIHSGYIDWSKTQAFSVGLGMVYVNLKGREAKGIVAPEEVDALLERISKDFMADVDPQSGKPFGRSAQRTRDIHEGPFLDREADLMLGFEAGYRVSWATTAGGLELAETEGGTFAPAPSVSDNDKTWSGDHVSVDPSLVQGIFFSSVPLAIPPGGLDLRHVAPTVLTLLGVGVPEECDLEPLERAR